MSMPGEYYGPGESDRSITFNFTWQAHILTGELVLEKTDMCSSHHLPVSHKEYFKFQKLRKRNVIYSSVFMLFAVCCYITSWQMTRTKFCLKSASRRCCFKHLFNSLSTLLQMQTFFLRFVTKIGFVKHSYFLFSCIKKKKQKHTMT